MARYRKKPVVIDAVQWRPGSNTDGVEERDDPENPGARIGVVQTIEGPLYAREGDWIITGVKGEKYPVKPDVFEATYEKVEDDAPAPAAPKKKRGWFGGGR